MKRTKRVVHGLLLSLALAQSAQAQAQEEPADEVFGMKGHLVVGGERMFGYAHTRQDETVDGSTRTTTLNAFSFLGTGLPASSFSSAYTFPRVGIDAFVAPSISLGGSVTYFHASWCMSGIDETLNGVLVAPRAGFAVRLAPAIWLWPRAGITYVHLWSDFGGTIQLASGSSSLFAATVEAPLVLALAPQALALIGPTVDVGLSGSNKTTDGTGSLKYDLKETDIGLHVSFMFYF